MSTLQTKIDSWVPLFIVWLCLFPVTAIKTVLTRHSMMTLHIATHPARDVFEDKYTNMDWTTYSLLELLIQTHMNHIVAIIFKLRKSFLQTWNRIEFGVLNVSLYWYFFLYEVK